MDHDGLGNKNIREKKWNVGKWGTRSSEEMKTEN